MRACARTTRTCAPSSSASAARSRSSSATRSSRSSARRSRTRTIRSAPCGRRWRSATGRARRTSSRCGWPSTPARRSSRSMRRPSGGEGMAAGDVAQHRGAPPVRRAGQRRPRRRADVPRDRARRSSTASTSRSRRRGRREPVPVWEAVAARSRLGVDVSQESRRAARRPGARARAPRRGRSGASCAEREPQLVTLVGVPGIGKIPARLRAPRSGRGRRRAHLLAPGPLPPLRRGRRVLGVRRDGQGTGRNPRDRLRREAQRKLAEMAGDLCEDDAAWVERALRPLVGLARRRQRTSPATRRSPPGGGWSRRWPTGVRPCSSSRICTGRTRGCSTSSTTSSTGRRGVPLLVRLHRPAGAARAAARLGRRQAATRPRSRSRALGRGDTARSWPACSAAPSSRPELLQFAGGNPLYAEEYARMLADRGLERRRCPKRCRGSSPRGSTRFSVEEKTAIQNGAVFGKVFWSGSLAALDGGESERSPAALARAQGVRPPRAPVVRRRTGRVRVPPRARPRRRLRPDPASRARGEAPARRGVDRVALGARRRPRRPARAPLRQRARVRRGRPRRAGGRAALREAGDRSTELNSYSTGDPVLPRRARAPPGGAPGRARRVSCSRSGARAIIAESTGAEELARRSSILEERNPELAADALMRPRAYSRSSDQKAGVRPSSSGRCARRATVHPPSEKGVRARTLWRRSSCSRTSRPARRELTQAALEIAEALGDDESAAQSTAVSRSKPPQPRRPRRAGGHGASARARTRVELPRDG